MDTRRQRTTIDDDDTASRMSDLETNDTRGLRRRSLSASPTASPSSSSQKMSIDSDDARSVSSMSTHRSQTLLPSEPRRLPSQHALTRCFATEQTHVPHSWSSFDEPRYPTSTPSTPTHPHQQHQQQQQQQQQHHYQRKWTTRLDRQHHRSLSSSSAEASSSSSFPSTSARPDPERRSVTRRSSLLPKSKALARVIHQADEETRPADYEMRRERDLTHQMKNRLEPEQSGRPVMVPPVPAAAWARIRSSDPSPTIAPYQCSKLNPEMEMTNFQFENLPSPVQQSFKSIKRKASEDRLYEPYPTNSLKRRAVSPSVSASGSPVLSGINSPPYALYGSSPTSNAAARAQQKPVSNGFNLQDASGGLSRMSLSE
ncbi:hypothetical protein BCR43DRAFT_514858 [Syncephalastrum racemosum]|uniref:Uncharacterized protein n=1 Tax=Syncephalastrum racemosum TaxID=13706 RepID=A0A1X2HCG2_SYNRA|nr:hypothetical protein BCR43DRAFT_514858 [Syncephalastrum racemosum]